MSRAVLVPTLAAALAAACDGRGAPHARASFDAAVRLAPPSPVERLELLAARDSVDNPDRPVYPDSAVALARLWEVTSGEWERPTHIALSPERVFVLDAGARAIHTVSRDGRPGPRADRYVGIRGPVGIAWSGGLLAVGDTAYGQVLIFEEFGPQRRATPAGDLSAVVAAGDRRFAVTGYRGEFDDWSLVGEFPSQDVARLLPPRPRGGGCTRVSGGRWMILADCASPTFRVYDPDELRPRRVTIARNAAGAAPDAVRGVRHDARGRRFAVWSAADGATQLDVLSEEGVYLARVRFPAPWLDFAFDGGTVFALEEGDPARLAAYSLRLPGDPSPRRTMGGAR